MNLSTAQWLETTAYQKQKETINREINTMKQVNGHALPRLAAPKEMLIDYSVFKKDMTEKMKTYTAVKNHRAELKEYFGNGYKKRLNTPNKSITPVKMTF